MKRIIVAGVVIVAGVLVGALLWAMPASACGGPCPTTTTTHTTRPIPTTTAPETTTTEAPTTTAPPTTADVMTPVPPVVNPRFAG